MTNRKFVTGLLEEDYDNLFKSKTQTFSGLVSHFSVSMDTHNMTCLQVILFYN